MAAKSTGYKKVLTGAEQRALAQQLSPTRAPSEASVREASFLRNITGAGDDLEWILLNQAWTQIGFERVGDWWEQRVLPVLDKLDLRPSASLAERVIAAIEADEQVLPKAQRRTQREIASIAKTSQSRVSRLLADSRESRSDLDKTSGAVPPANTKTAAGAPTTPADGADTPEASVSDTAPAGSADASPVGGPGNPHTAADDALGIRAMSSADGGERDRDRVDPPAAAEPLVTGLGGGNPQNSPAADSLPSQAHAGVPAVGGTDQERIDEEAASWDVVWRSSVSGKEIDRETHGSYAAALAVQQRAAAAGSIASVDIEPTPGSPAADPMPHIPTELAYPIAVPQQPGQDSPTRVEGRGSEANSSAGLDQQDLRSDRAPEVPAVATTALPGIDHHDESGVSRRGEAPEVPRPSVELEDGVRASLSTPSSSDPDDEQTSTDLLLMTFGALIKLIDHLDVEAVAPTLFPAELEQLHQHVEAVSAFVSKVSRLRFESLTRPL